MPGRLATAKWLAYYFPVEHGLVHSRRGRPSTPKCCALADASKLGCMWRATWLSTPQACRLLLHILSFKTFGFEQLLQPHLAKATVLQECSSRLAWQFLQLLPDSMPFVLLWYCRGRSGSIQSQRLLGTRRHAAGIVSGKESCLAGLHVKPAVILMRLYTQINQESCRCQMQFTGVVWSCKLESFMQNKS